MSFTFLCIGLMFIVPMHPHQPIGSPHFSALPGKVIGILVSNTDAQLSAERRHVPPGSVLFSRDDDSVRVIFLHSPNDPEADDLLFLVGGLKEEKKFVKVRMASQESMKAAGLPNDFALVEVEVNGGAGVASGIDRFVMTSLRKLDGVTPYSINVSKSVANAVKKATKRLAENENTQAVNNAIQLAGKDIKAQDSTISNREENVETRVKWQSELNILQVIVTTRIFEGVYGKGKGTINNKYDSPSMRTGVQYGVVVTSNYEFNQQGEMIKENHTQFKPYTQKLDLFK